MEFTFGPSSCVQNIVSNLPWVKLIVKRTCTDNSNKVACKKNTDNIWREVTVYTAVGIL
jgi:hypothetical protein